MTERLILSQAPHLLGIICGAIPFMPLTNFRQLAALCFLSDSTVCFLRKTWLCDGHARFVIDTGICIVANVYIPCIGLAHLNLHVDRKADRIVREWTSYPGEREETSCRRQKSLHRGFRRDVCFSPRIVIVFAQTREMIDL